MSWAWRPEGIHEFLTQRIRWCRGSLEIAMNREWGPRRNPRLAGYLQYLEGTYRWAWHSVAKVAWMLIPPAYFFFGFTVLEADLLEFVGYFAPILVARFGMTWMNRNRDPRSALQTFPAATEGCSSRPTLPSRTTSSTRNTMTAK